MEEDEDREHIETAKEKEARFNLQGGPLYWHKDKYYINIEDHCGLWHYKVDIITKKPIKKGKKYYQYDKLRWNPVTGTPIFSDHAFARRLKKGYGEHSCSLKDTHFMWQDGSQYRKKYFKHIMTDYQSLEAEFDFVKPHAPVVWLNEDKWFPSDTDFHLEHTVPKNVKG
jgi:hypothetical protein